MPRWIRVPRLGQMRGQGDWLTLAECNYGDDDWEELRDTGYLPTHEGDAPPEVDDGAGAPA